jgi:hypothetical protein
MSFFTEFKQAVVRYPYVQVIKNFVRTSLIGICIGLVSSICLVIGYRNIDRLGSYKEVKYDQMIWPTRIPFLLPIQPIEFNDKRGIGLLRVRDGKIQWLVGDDWKLHVDQTQEEFLAYGSFPKDKKYITGFHVYYVQDNNVMDEITPLGLDSAESIVTIFRKQNAFPIAYLMKDSKGYSVCVRSFSDEERHIPCTLIPVSETQPDMSLMGWTDDTPMQFVFPATSTSVLLAVDTKHSTPHVIATTTELIVAMKDLFQKQKEISPICGHTLPFKIFFNRLLVISDEGKWHVHWTQEPILEVVDFFQNKKMLLILTQKGLEAYNIEKRLRASQKIDFSLSEQTHFLCQ